jgi:hypothetical protein
MLAAAAVLAAGVPLLGAPAAHAAAYRYWSYWHVDGGTWQFSQVGAGGWRVADGSVEGWHFAVSPNTRSAAPPRYAAGSAFTKLCGSEPKPAGKVRVALVLDYGVAADYPPGEGPPGQPLQGECFTVPERSTGVDVLNAAEVSIRDQGGLICALDGHPSTGCGEVVSDPDPTPTKTARPTRTPTSQPSRRPSRTASPAPTRTAEGGSATPGRTTRSASATPDGEQPTPADATTTAVAGTGSDASPTPSDTAAGSVSGPPAAPTSDAAAPDASPTLAVGLAASQTTDSGTPWPALVVVVVVAALGGVAYWLRRRSS